MKRTFRCRQCRTAIRNGRCACPGRVRFRAYLPTPEQITEACEAIRATWSAETEYDRRAVKNGSHDYGRERSIETE